MVKKTGFKCKECDHRFRQNYAPKLCPNCGREAIAVDHSRGAADELLKEIEDIQDQFK